MGTFFPPGLDPSYAGPDPAVPLSVCHEQAAAPRALLNQSQAPRRGRGSTTGTWLHVSPAGREGNPASTSKGANEGLVVPGRAWGLHPCKTGPDHLTGASSKPNQYGAGAAKAECYIPRVKATIRRGKPPWKCTRQTVMAP